MIGYVCLGTNDLARATKYYDALLAGLGAKRFMDFDTFKVWGTGKGKAGLALTVPYDGKPATVGNGVMVAIDVGTPAKVDEMYRKAMELGSRDEGPAGPRGDGFYAGYFRDLDGNKLNFYCMT
jgi:catechol 2,3-dioxygenase-like lactoylglutathione lyase family enzyme